jgi:hypothetical protein
VTRAALDFPDAFGKVLSLAQGKDCVAIMVKDERGMLGGVVLSPDQAREVARSLRLRAKYAEEAR